MLDGEKSVRPWSDRSLFRAILETYDLFPITVDSHLGEYVAWAQDVVDHRGILDFYDYYRHSLSRPAEAEITLQLRERLVPIMEGIIQDAGFEERAVNILNHGCIPGFPDDVAVEVPAVVDKQGVTGIRLESYPRGFGALIRDYAGVYDLTAEAVLTRRKDLVIQAVLAMPGVSRYHGVSEMVELMLERQAEWLGYLE